MTSNVDRMEEAALNKAGSETLVRRLRQMDRGYPTILSTAADRIERLEQELSDLRHDQTEWMTAIEQANKNGQEYADLQAKLATEKAMANQLASDLGSVLSERDAEKALADQLYGNWMSWFNGPDDMDYAEFAMYTAYRKARGL